MSCCVSGKDNPRSNGSFFRLKKKNQFGSERDTCYNKIVFIPPDNSFTRDKIFQRSL